MIERIVINGCSYNEVYCGGPGPKALADSLGIAQVESLSKGGSANSRILRTTLKHSYRTHIPTLYLVGLTFINRWELPVIEATKDREFEGRWINPQSQAGEYEQWQFNWTREDTDTFKDLQFKAATLATEDNLEDLMYRCIGMISDLKKRGHRALVWNNCDLSIADAVKDNPRFKLLKAIPEFVDSLAWAAVPWQHQQGARPSEYSPGYVVPTPPPPGHLRHILPEDYQHLNNYLTNYIRQHKILE